MMQKNKAIPDNNVQDEKISELKKNITDKKIVKIKLITI